jgi:hypothetical protein
MNDLIVNIDKLHTTQMSIERIKRKLSIECPRFSLSSSLGGIILAGAEFNILY